jgi:hypothetical protein
MSNTRNGKIARLPKHIRDGLGRRIENGEPGKDLVEWLNGLPAVQDALKQYLAGHPVTEQQLIERHCAPLLAQPQVAAMAELFGGGEMGEDIAAYILELQKGLPQGALGRKPITAYCHPPSPSPDQTKSG